MVTGMESEDDDDLERIREIFRKAGAPAILAAARHRVLAEHPELKGIALRDAMIKLGLRDPQLAERWGKVVEEISKHIDVKIEWPRR